jgi:hypothetical protein
MNMFRRSALITAYVSISWTTESPAQVAEPVNIPSFHRVHVVNNTLKYSVVPTESGVLTAAVEMRHSDGQWRAVAKLRAPAGTNRRVVMCGGEIWQFIVPLSPTGNPVKARLALDATGGTIYSQPFEINLDPLLSSQTLDCWLARIRPAQLDHGPVFAAGDN